MNLHLYMDSVPLTYEVVSLLLTNNEVYSIQHYFIKCVGVLLQVVGFLKVLNSHSCNTILFAMKSYLIKEMASPEWGQISSILLNLHLKSDLIWGMTFGGRDLIIEVAFGGRDLIREVAFGGRDYCSINATTNKTDHNDTTEILKQVSLNTYNLNTFLQNISVKKHQNHTV